MINYETLNKIIKESGNMSAVARKTNIDKSTLSRIINKEIKNIKIETICKIASAYNLSFDELLIKI